MKTFITVICIPLFSTSSTSLKSSTAMEKKESLPLGVIFLALLLLLPLTFGQDLKASKGQRTWCVAKPSTDDVTLQNNIHYACSIVKCSSFETNGPCFSPDTVISHASVAMNLYYQTNGRNNWNCHFNGTGLVVITDPSYGNCKYA